MASAKRPSFGTPRGGRDLDHAAKQTLLRTAAQQHRIRRRVSARRRRRNGPAVPVFLPAPAALSTDPLATAGTRAAPRTEYTARPARRADHRAEIHHRLSEVARPLRRDQRCSERSQTRLRRRQRLVDRIEAGDHSLDIAVDGSIRADRRRSRRSPPRCSRRSRGARATRPVRSGMRRRSARRHSGRRHADCALARNSRAPATCAGSRRARPRRAPKCRATAPRIGQNTVRRSLPSSAAA